MAGRVALQRAARGGAGVGPRSILLQIHGRISGRTHRRIGASALREAKLPTYKAILQGNHLEWRVSVRQHPPTDRPIAVHVAILDEPLGEVNASEKGQGTRTAATFERLAEIHALADITDAAAWERKARRERALPGRDARGIAQKCRETVRTLPESERRWGHADAD
jgi:hypothetical protein